MSKPVYQIKEKLHNKYNFKRVFKEIKRKKVCYALIAPYLLLFLVFTVLPVIISIVLSFTEYNVIEKPNFIGWSNYIQLLLDDRVFLIAVKNTFIFAIITGPISYFACLIFAWLINELRPKLRAWVTLIFYAPSISGNVFLIWTYIFGGDAYGLINSTLMKWGFLNEPILWLQDTAINLKVIMCTAGGRSLEQFPCIIGRTSGRTRVCMKQEQWPVSATDGRNFITLPFRA